MAHFFIQLKIDDNINVVLKAHKTIKYKSIRIV